MTAKESTLLAERPIAKEGKGTNRAPGLFAMLKGELGSLSLLAVFWLAAILVVSLGGDFPLNDDWIYSESVRHFLQSGELRLLACAPACIFHLLTGAAVCKVVGFSHVALRCTGLFWALASTFAVYGTCRQLNLKKLPALLFAFVWAVNPLVINLAFSFMTDMPALALVSIYTFFVVRGLKTQSPGSFLLAGIALACAACVRQNFAMLAIPNALVLLGLWLTRRIGLSVLLFLVVMPVVAGVAADKWMVASNDFPELYLWYKGRAVATVRELLHAPGRLAGPMTQTAGSVMGYVGLFLAPILVPFVLRAGKIFGYRPAVNPAWTGISAAVMAYATTMFVSAGRLMPFNQNLFRLPSIGAHSILGINYLNMSNRFRSGLTTTSTFLGFISLAVLGEGLTRSLVLAKRTLVRQKLLTLRPQLGGSAGQRAAARPLVLLFLFASFALQLGCVVLQSSFNDIDRYYVFPFLSALFCVAAMWKWLRIKSAAWICAVVLLAYGVYGIAACQDMMAWNKARWAGIAVLEHQGVKPGQIDGGSEYNYFSQPELFKQMKIYPTWYEFIHRGAAPRDNWRWWTVDKEDYIVSFSPVPGYITVNTQKYYSLLSLKEREILVLKKEDL